MYQRGLAFEDEFSLETPERSYREVDLEEMKQGKYAGSGHAAHVAIFTPTDITAMKVFNVRAYILMQLRFDGYLGFPGGLLEPGNIFTSELVVGETPEEAIAREVEERFGMLRQNFKLFADDHVVTHYSEDKDLFLHLFSKDVNLDRFGAMEVAALKNDRYGDEVMGIVRVPLFTMADGYRGLPSFLNNNFVGNSKQQLLKLIEKKGILKKEEIESALASKPKFIDKNKNFIR